MSDFRLSLVQDIVQQIQAVILDDRCPKCKFPLVMKMEQDIAFCWGCLTDKTTATQGRTLLLKARLAEKGIEIPHSIIEGDHFMHSFIPTETDKSLDKEFGNTQHELFPQAVRKRRLKYCPYCVKKVGKGSYPVICPKHRQHHQEGH